MALKLKTDYKGFQAEYFSIVRVLSDKSSLKSIVSLALFKDEQTSKEVDTEGVRVGLKKVLTSQNKIVSGINLPLADIYTALKAPKLVNGVNVNPLTDAIDC